jgi:hypothetical protein
MHQGANIPQTHEPLEITQALLNAAKTNTDIWTQLLWISGGIPNPKKCFVYLIRPKLNYKTVKVEYDTSDDYQ